MSPDRLGGDRDHALFGDARRRFALYYLLSNERTDTESLALQIAAWEAEESIADVSPEHQRSVKIALHHCHLPKLAARNVLEFDHRHGDVVVAEGFERLRPFVEEYRKSEEAVERRDATKRPLYP